MAEKSISIVEAIEAIEADLKAGYVDEADKFVKAMGLGKEALYRLRIDRIAGIVRKDLLLPGETEESSSPLKGEEGQGDDPKKGDRK